MNYIPHYKPFSMVKILPPELVKLIVSYVPDTEISKDCDFGASPYTMNAWPNIGTPTAASKRRLAKLRLVSSDFWAAASALLFEQLAIVYEHNVDNSKTLALAKTICEGPCGEFVRELKIGLSRETKQGRDGLASFVQDISVLLPLFLSKLPNVESIILCRPLNLTVKRRTPQEDLTPFNQAAKSFPGIVLNALRYINLPKMVRLSVCLPEKMDMNHSMDENRTNVVTPMSDLVGRLRYLDIKSSGSCCIYTPYKKLISHLFVHVSYESLEHLSIGTTKGGTVDMDKYLFGSGFSRLHTLRLVNVDVSESAFCPLLARTLRHIALYDASLTSGRWHKVLSRMLELEGLCQLLVSHCGYAANGASLHLRPQVIIRRGADPGIHTTENVDLQYLELVRQKVSHKRRVLGLK